jgi:putative transposase
VDQRLKALFQQKTQQLEITIHSLQIMPDHVQLSVEADPTRCVAEMVNRLKGFTSHLLRTEFVSLRSRLPTLWSRSYYAGSVGWVSEAVVRKYIAGQKRR